MNTRLKTYFIADLHLDHRRPQIIQLFLNFLSEIKTEKKTVALYILGDLFEYWIGDDVLDSPLGKPFFCVIQALKQLSNANIKLYFIHGNRDFLIGKHFAQQCGLNLLSTTKIIHLYGERVLIMHGDTLCTDDIEYQKTRKIIRSSQWKRDFLNLSIPARIQYAQSLRQQSKKSTQRKKEIILDANQKTIENVMRANNVTTLIHGHTHRPTIHHFMLDNKKATRFVLGDWYKTSHFLIFPFHF